MTEEYNLTCKYCGKIIKKNVKKVLYDNLQGNISHPKCYNLVKRQKKNERERTESPC